ncbi:MAG: sugar ABC transporter permease [Planctomycetota bacterium]
MLRARRMIGLYLLLLPTLLSMAVFGYYPKLDVLIKSMYRWTPGTIEEFVGVRNFIEVLGDPLFWQSFKVVVIMLLANLVKMWPAIIVAIALHRITSDRMRYGLQVMFVVPMVVPGMVWLLVWKSFYDPELGIFNRALNATGLMPLLAWLDGSSDAPGVMPRVASGLRPVVEGVVAPVFGGVWALIALGGVLLIFSVQRRTQARRWWGYGLLLATPWLAPTVGGLAVQEGGQGVLLAGGALVLWLFALAATLGKGWIIWPLLTIYGLWACRHEPWRFAALLTAGVALGEWCHRRWDHLIAPDLLRRVGLAVVVVGAALVGFGMIWTQPTEQFAAGTPAWLGSQELVLPALIIWGFPWVGTVGVLIYLAGLQQISHDVYEAAELDGVGPIGKLFRIELPLIMTQVRINLIFMTIGTLTAYELYLILLGQDGGPGNVGMVPGLYMYRSAFVDLRYGYACALGMVMFVIILLLTIIYQKYVKVEK